MFFDSLLTVKATIKVAKIMAMKTIDATMRTNIEQRERSKKSKEDRFSVNTSFGVFLKRNYIFGGVGLFFFFFTWRKHGLDLLARSDQEGCTVMSDLSYQKTR